MKDIIKGLWKWILWILVILIIGGLILAFRIFVIDRDYNGKSSSSSNSSKSKNTTDTINSSRNNSNVRDTLKTIGNATIKGYKEDKENTYNVHNFDEAFLMYEGEQDVGKVKNVLDHLIENSMENFYARTSVTARNFGNNITINYNNDVTEYQNAIRELKNILSDGMYEISFGYGALHSYVNEIIITKK